MRRIYSVFLIAILVGFVACQSSSSQQAAIEKLEQEVANEPTAANQTKLLDAYQAYLQEFPDDTEHNPGYLYKMAQLQRDLNRYPEALATLKQALLDYYDTPTTVENALLLADIYNNNLRNQAAATTAHQAFLLAFPNAEQVPGIQQQLPDSIPPLAQRITNLYRGVFDTSTQQINYPVANDFITTSEVHALLLPNDEQSPALLQESAELAAAIDAYPKAIELYEWVVNYYPDSEKAAQSLFLMAFMYENDLQQLEEARMYYQQFLQKYPDHEFADDAEAMLQNLGKTPEEILQQMEQPEN